MPAERAPALGLEGEKRAVLVNLTVPDVQHICGDLDVEQGGGRSRLRLPPCIFRSVGFVATVNHETDGDGQQLDPPRVTQTAR